jgi:hypothetical protein
MVAPLRRHFDSGYGKDEFLVLRDLKVLRNMVAHVANLIENEEEAFQ